MSGCLFIKKNLVICTLLRRIPRQVSTKGTSLYTTRNSEHLPTKIVGRTGRIGTVTFSILYDLEQIINHPTHIPDRHDRFHNTVFFFTSNPSGYNYTISPPTGSPEHILLSVSLVSPPRIPPT